MISSQIPLDYQDIEIGEPKVFVSYFALKQQQKIYKLNYTSFMLDLYFILYNDVTVKVLI